LLATAVEGLDAYRRGRAMVALFGMGAALVLLFIGIHNA
jgi:hypothetical protein